MAIAEFTTGTKAVDTNEWSMADTSTANGELFSTATPLTTDGIFQIFLDLSDMVAGDILQIRMYEKVRSADTQRVFAEWVFRDVQSTPVWPSPAVLLLHGWDMTADALAGTITVNWSIRQVS